jgi:hypothetical protein
MRQSPAVRTLTALGAKAALLTACGQPVGGAGSVAAQPEEAMTMANGLYAMVTRHHTRHRSI